MNSNHSEQTSVPPSAPLRRRWLTSKRILIAIACLLVLLSLLALAGLIYIRSENFNRYVTELMKSKLNEYGMRGEIGGFKLGWRDQSAQLLDIKIYNQQNGMLIASVKRAEIIAEVLEPYAFRLSREIVIKKLNLEEVHLYVETDEQGRTNFEGLRIPPSTPTRITFDTSQLLATLTGSAIHLHDRSRKIEAELGDIKAYGQPSPQNPTVVNLQLDGSAGRVRSDGRETKIDKLNLVSRVSGSGAEIEQFNFNSNLADANARGKLDDWKALRYGFDFDLRVKLDETARLFLPEVKMTGVAAGKGRIEGEGDRYNIKSTVNAGDVTADKTALRNVEITQLQIDGQAGKIDFTSSKIAAQSLVIDSSRIENVSVSNLKGNFKDGRAQGSASTANIAGIVFAEGNLSNLALNDLTLDYNLNQREPRFEGKAGASLKEGIIADIKFNNVTTKAAFNNTALALNEMKADLLGGKVTGNFTLPLTRGAASKASASFTDLQTKEVLSVIASKDARSTINEVPVSGKVSGEAEISFISDNLRSIDGAVKAQFKGAVNETSDAIPVTGEVAITAQNGVFNFDQFQLQTDVSKLAASGKLSVDGDSDLRVTLTSIQAEQLLQIARSFDAARPYLADYEPQLIGDFNFDGRVYGQRDNTMIEGDVNAATVGLRDALLGSLSGHLILSEKEIRFEKGVISASNGGSMKFDLTTPFDSKADTGKLDLIIDRINLETILAAAGSPNASQFIVGDVSGEAHLTGLPGSLSGSAQINLVDGKIADQPAERATAALKFDGKNAQLETLEVKLQQSTITASGAMNLDDYSFKAQGKADKISLDSLAQTLELKETRIEGMVNADLVISGKVITGKQPDLDWESLQVYLLAQGEGVKINGRDAGELRLGAKTSPGGRLEFGLITGILATAKTPTTQNQPEVLRGSIELRKPGRPVVIEGDLNNQNIAPILQIFAPNLGSTIAGTLGGKLRIEGPTLDENGQATSERLRGGLTLTDIALEVEGTQVKIETPLTIALEGMQLKINNTHIIGEGVDLNFGGVVGLRGDAGWNFTLNGTVNLNRLPAIPEDIFLSGTAKVDVQLRGTSEAPNLGGKIDVNGFGLSMGDLPVFILDGAGSITLSGDQIKLGSFKANLNDGTLEVNGGTKLAQLRPSEWKFNIKADNAVIDYQDISATANGNLTLTGTPQGQQLSGTINIPQAEYTPRLDLDNLLAGGTAGLGLTGFGTGGGIQTTRIPTINLDVRVEANDTLTVQTKQINAVGSALLTLTGTLNDPNLIGRIETDGGLVRFRGQRYEITVGALDFPQVSSEPTLNLIAESDISGYRVTIGFVGPLDNIELTLRSEPQLVRDEIISLITTGRTETSTFVAQDPIRSGFGAAASLLTSGLISRPTEQLLGISRFQLDPVIRPNANPAARLTIGQQFSRNFYLSYSTNLSGEQDQTALAEYTISNRFSAVATYTQGGTASTQGSSEGDFTIELRGRKRFSLGFKPDAQLASTSTSNTAKEPFAGVTRPKLPSAQVQVGQVPNLKLSDKKLRELLPVMTQGFSRSLARLGERRLREHLQEQGYFFAEVRYRCEPENCSGDGLRVFYDIEPNAIYDLEEIRIEGTGLVKLREIEGEMQSQTASKVGGIPFLKDLPLIGGYVRGLTSNDRLRNDAETIRRHLQELGFRNARVNSRLAVKPESDDLVVIFDVEEGTQSEVAGIKVRGNTILSENEVREVVPIKRGEAFSLTRARTGAQQIRQLYAERGFLEIAAELELLNVDEDSVLLIYNINEGQRAIVSEIEFTGLTKTSENWVRRYLAFKKGDVLTPLKIRETQRDLYATNSFREVNIRTEPIAGGDGSAHKVTINLTEAKPLLLVYGLGYSTDDGARGLMEIANTNLGGTLDSLSLRLRGSRREQFAQMSFTDLRPFSWRLPTTMSIFYQRTSNLRPFVRRRVLNEKNEPVDSTEDVGFGLQRYGAFVQTERKLGERTSLRFRYKLDYTNLFDIDETTFPQTEVTRNEDTVKIGMFSAGFTHDTRDSALNPTRGRLISADHSLASNIFGGNESFNKFFGTFQQYKTLGTNFPLLGNSTLAFSARIGLASLFRVTDRNHDSIINESEERLPINERFFSGGATTLRGFRFETAGPQEILQPRPGKSCDLPPRPCDLPSLVPIGGDALAIFNFELRYPLTQRFRLVAFYDLGNVFRRVQDFNFSNMTHTVGLGLRVNTPLGPIGVDYGYLIDPPSFGRPPTVLRQPSGAFHIRFGQSF